MKKWLMGVLITLLIVLVGCSENTSLKTNEQKQDKKEIEKLDNNEIEKQDKKEIENKDKKENEKESDKENIRMTEEQEKIFRSYGLTDEEIEKMKQDGLSIKAQGFVEMALMMLNYLEEKYNEKFEVVGGDIPGILTDECWIAAKALEGDYVGEKFDVYYWPEYDRYTDGYITLLKHEEASEELKKLLLSKFSNVLIFPYLNGEHGSDLTIDHTGEELLKTYEHYFDIIITDSDLLEEEFHRVASDIQKFLEDNDVSSSGGVRYLNGAVDLNMTVEDFDELLNNIDVFRWHDYIRSGD